MKNFDKFNELSATIFPMLYESFPIEIDIKLEEFPEYVRAVLKMLSNPRFENVCS